MSTSETHGPDTERLNMTCGVLHSLILGLSFWYILYNAVFEILVPAGVTLARYTDDLVSAVVGKRV